MPPTAMNTRSTFAGKRALLPRKSSRNRRLARLRCTAPPRRLEATNPARVGPTSAWAPISNRKLRARTRAPGWSCKRTKSIRFFRRSARGKRTACPNSTPWPARGTEEFNRRLNQQTQFLRALRRQKRAQAPALACPWHGGIQPEVESTNTALTSGKRPVPSACDPCGDAR